MGGFATFSLSPIYKNLGTRRPQSCFSKKLFGDDFKKLELSPLCIDLELASVCDLACPHCFRQTVATPDKIMNKNPKVRISQKIWETQNSGFNCGISSDSAPYTFEKNVMIERNK